MKKWLSVIVVALVLVLAACGSKDKSSSSESGLDKIKKDKVLVIGTNAGYYPFEMIDKSGKMVGYDMDLANAIAKEIGAKVEVKQYGFDALIPALQSGKIDMIFAGITINKDREKVVDFSTPYYETGQAVMVNEKSKVKKIEELDKKGNTIGVQIGTTGAIVAKKVIKNADIKEFEDFPTAALAVQQGKIDSVVYDEAAIKVYALQYKGKVHALDGLLGKDKLGIAIKKGDTALVNNVNDFLKTYLGSEEEKKAKEKWFNNSDWLNSVDAPN